MRLEQLASRTLLAISIATSPVPSALLPPAYAAAPSAEAQAQLRKGFQAAQAGLYSSADSLLSKSISEWEQTNQPPDERAALYKTRGMVRADQSRQADALSDLSKALSLSLQPGSRPDPAEIQRTYQLRARVNRELGDVSAQAADLTEAIKVSPPFDLISRMGRAGSAAHKPALPRAVEPQPRV